MINVNYQKEVLTHNYNLGLVGVLLFLMFITGSFVGFAGWVFLIASVELTVFALSYTSAIQRIIYLENKGFFVRALNDIEDKLFSKDRTPSDLKQQYFFLKELCESIGNAEILTEDSLLRVQHSALLLLEEYLNYSRYQDKSKLESAIKQFKQQEAQETNHKIKNTLSSHINILTQRRDKIEKDKERQKEIVVELNLLVNALSLLQESKYSNNSTEANNTIQTLLQTLNVGGKTLSEYTIEDLVKK